jgi:hypothetical protein
MMVVITVPSHSLRAASLSIHFSAPAIIPIYSRTNLRNVLFLCSSGDDDADRAWEEFKSMFEEAGIKIDAPVPTPPKARDKTAAAATSNNASRRGDVDRANSDAAAAAAAASSRRDAFRAEAAEAAMPPHLRYKHNSPFVELHKPAKAAKAATVSREGYEDFDEFHAMVGYADSYLADAYSPPQPDALDDGEDTDILNEINALAAEEDEGCATDGTEDVRGKDTISTPTPSETATPTPNTATATTSSAVSTDEINAISSDDSAAASSESVGSDADMDAAETPMPSMPDTSPPPSTSPMADADEIVVMPAPVAMSAAATTAAVVGTANVAAATQAPATTQGADEVVSTAKVATAQQTPATTQAPPRRSSSAASSEGPLGSTARLGALPARPRVSLSGGAKGLFAKKLAEVRRPSNDATASDSATL